MASSSVPENICESDKVAEDSISEKATEEVVSGISETSAAEITEITGVHEEAAEIEEVTGVTENSVPENLTQSEQLSEKPLKKSVETEKATNIKQLSNLQIRALAVINAELNKQKASETSHENVPIEAEVDPVSDIAKNVEKDNYYDNVILQTLNKFETQPYVANARLEATSTVDPVSTSEVTASQTDKSNVSMKSQFDTSNVSMTSQTGSSNVSMNSVTNKKEKNARKAISKLGLKTFSSIKCVIIKKTNNSMILIQNPDVKWNPKTVSYVIFGEYKEEDLSKQVNAAEDFKPKSTAPVSPVASTNPVDDEDLESPEKVREEEVAEVVELSVTEETRKFQTNVAEGNDRKVTDEAEDYVPENFVQHEISEVLEKAAETEEYTEVASSSVPENVSESEEVAEDSIPEKAPDTEEQILKMSEDSGSEKSAEIEEVTGVTENSAPENLTHSERLTDEFLKKSAETEKVTNTKRISNLKIRALAVINAELNKQKASETAHETVSLDAEVDPVSHIANSVDNNDYCESVFLQQVNKIETPLSLTNAALKVTNTVGSVSNSELTATQFDTSNISMTSQFDTSNISMTSQTDSSNVSMGNVTNKKEKKARKAISKLGLKNVSSIKCVIIKKTNNSVLVIQDPEVKWNPKTGPYVIFGEYKVEDLDKRAHVAAAEDFKQKSTTPVSPVPSTYLVDDAKIEYSQLEEKDIELVMQHANVSRRQAATALINNDKNIVDAICESLSLVNL